MTRGPAPMSMCTICNNPWRLEIESEILSGDMNVLEVAIEYSDISAHALYRHIQNGHIGILTVAPTDQATKVALLNCNSVLQELSLLHYRAMNIEFQATESGQSNLALHAQESQRRSLESWIKLATMVKDMLQDADIHTNERHISTMNDWNISKRLEIGHNHDEGEIR